MFPTVMLVLNVSSVAVLWFGATAIAAGSASQIGALTAFLSYLMQILMSVMMATFMLIMIPRAAVCAERIIEVLDTESVGRAAGRARSPSRPSPATVELRGVEFSYPGASRPVLRDISFVAGPGETTAIIGSTGAGKTTLLDLIPRLFDATAGTVLVDGVDVRELDDRGAVGADRPGAAAAVPVHRHGRDATCGTATPTPPTRSCGLRSRSRRPRTSCARCPSGSRRRSRRAAPTSRAASASASRSRARSCASPRSTSSTTRSRRSTWHRRPAARGARARGSRRRP